MVIMSSATEPSLAMQGRRIVLGPEQREAIVGQLLDHLSGIDALRQAVLEGNLAKAERIGGEFSDELRLILEDLGWGSARGEAVTLSLPSTVLRRVFSRIRKQAEAQQASEQAERDELEAHWGRARLVIETCDQVLATLPVERRGMKISSVTPQIPR